MSNINNRGFTWFVVMSFMIMAMPLLAFANGPATGIEQIKQLRHVQNQSTILKNLEVNSTAVKATPEQERMLGLSKALTSMKNQPDLGADSRLNLRRTDRPVSQLQTGASRDLRDVMYGSGQMFMRPDSIYFNFLTGMMGGDTLDMDVMISSNEGTNFGSEGAWVDGVSYPFFTDPSLIYYYSEFGSMDTVSAVPSVDDPSAVWTTISWDWQGGNNGQPLAPGNLWVIYTRTTNMYVVMQVTDVSAGWTNNWFTFDYMIQTDGSNLFDGEPSLFDLTVNGEEGDTLLIGSNPYVEILLDGSMYGEFAVIWDGNHNGMLDDGDVGMEIYEFMDNDMHDEDPADGVFGFTYTDDMADGLNYLVGDLLFVGSTDMAMDIAPVQFYTVPSPFSVSGSIYETNGGGAPLEGIVVWAVYESSEDDEQPAVIVTTDGAGQYHLDLPDTGNVMIGTEDHFGVTDYLLPDPSHHFVNVQSNEFGYNFYYIAPTAGIEGFVYDEMGNPLADVEVKVDGDDGPGAYGYTDGSGYYHIPVMPGYYDVGVDTENLPGPYVVPHSVWVEVGDFAVTTVNFTLHTANNYIYGVVTLDGVYYEGATVVAMNELGFSYTMSTGNGYFEVPVHGGPETFYDLMVWLPDMSDIIQTSMNHQVPAGAEGQMITLETVPGGLFGLFMDAETGQPIMNAHDVGMMMRNIDTGMEFYGGPDYDGYYELHVPAGLYEVMAGGHNWMGPEPDTVMVTDFLIEHDFYLTHISYDASLEGYVYDDAGMPIPHAQIQIGNENWGSGTMADEFGYYYFDLPVGYYFVSAWAPGFNMYFDEFPIGPGYNSYNFFLEAYQIDGAIGGLVYDADSGSPVMDANVYAHSWDDDEGFWTYTNHNGEYWFDLPNGMYDVVVEHWDYPPMWMEGIPVNDDTTFVDFALEYPDGGVEGYVYDDQGYPIHDAEVVIISTIDSTGFWGYTDGNGYYSIPAMNGQYHIMAGAPGFHHSNPSAFDINDNWVSIDIYLEPRDFAMAPEINFIIDQPNDQGRWVRMQFMPGGTDWGPYHAYSIWRMTNTPMGPIMDFVDYLPNHDFDMYNVVLPTLVDSSMYVPDPEDYMSMFMVTGHYDMYGYVDGEPGIGYSIDNIHPGVPSPLVLLSSDETQVDMQWEPIMDDDFQYFEVHRATHADFTDGAIIEMTTNLGTSDTDLTVGQTYYYQVFAVDANGNASEGSNVINTTIVSIDDAELLPTVFGLSQNYPNPFNPTTSIEFALPQASDVNLVIYNILGQKVRTLVNGYMPAGYITTSWDGLDQNGREISSGTYIYRLDTPDESFSKKMVLMK